MKRVFLLVGLGLSLISCEKINSDQSSKSSKTTSSQETTTDSLAQNRLEAQVSALKEKGYQTFLYPEQDTTYLMQQYYMVFLTTGSKRTQDSASLASLQKAHLAHLERMAQEGYTSLTGPFGDDGRIRGIVVYNTPTLQEADSLARLDPMVKAGRLNVEIHPWWTAKGGKLK